MDCCGTGKNCSHDAAGVDRCYGGIVIIDLFLALVAGDSERLVLDKVNPVTGCFIPQPVQMPEEKVWVSEGRPSVVPQTRQVLGFRQSAGIQS